MPISPGDRPTAPSLPPAPDCCIASASMSATTSAAMLSSKRMYLAFWPTTDRLPGPGPTNTAPWLASTATRSAGATWPHHRFRRPRTNRDSRGRHRPTSTRMTSCSACSAPSISAGSARSSSTATPCGRCSCFSTARGCGWRGAAPVARRCRPARCDAVHTRYQVLQDPPRSCRSSTCRCPAGLRRQTRGVPVAEGL